MAALLILVVVTLFIMWILITCMKGTGINKEGVKSISDSVYNILDKNGVVPTYASTQLQVHYDSISKNDTLNFYIVDTNKKVLMYWNIDIQANPYQLYYVTIPFNIITGAEIFEDGQTTNAVGRAVAGGFLFGEAGAIVGANTATKNVNHLFVRIYLSTINDPYKDFILIDKFDISTTSSIYKGAVDLSRELIGSVKSIIENQK